MTAIEVLLTIQHISREDADHLLACPFIKAALIIATHAPEIMKCRRIEVADQCAPSSPA